MSNESANKIVGGVILAAVVIVIISFVGAVKALLNNEYLGAGVLMLAASLPIAATILGVLKNKE